MDAWLVTLLCALMAALGTLGGAWFSRRRKKEIDAGVAEAVARAMGQVSERQDRLLEQLQEERATLSAELTKEREQYTHATRNFRAMVEGLQRRLSKLNSNVMKLIGHVGDLEDLVRTLGQEPPTRPELDGDPA